MCTAISFLSKDHYFGRTLDLEYSYEETVTITPRNYPLHFRRKNTLESHFALIGMAYVQKQYPLYYEATNEYGLSMAGLHFPRYAKYKLEDSSKDNITPFEFIPWILGQCKTVEESRHLLDNINLWNENFSEDLPLTPLHWMISDSRHSIVIESTEKSFKVYKNPTGVMTNTPAFDQHLHNLKKDDTIPGDNSSQSRFLRAVHVKNNSVHPVDECERISQFFHILGSVEQTKGHKYTVYSCCCNTCKGIYYYKSYNNSQITAVDLHRENLDSAHLISYPLIRSQQIRMQN